MIPEDRKFASPRRVTLRDGREVTIRLIETNDLPEMIAFYKDVTVIDGVYYRGSPETLVAGAPKWVPAAADNPYMVCLIIAADDGSIHGEAWYQWRESDKSNSLFGICIRPTMQGQGAGRLIMSRLMEIGDTYGPPRMNLTVQLPNTRAWKLYTSLGFRPIYEQMRPARADAPEMPEFYMERVMGTAPKRERKPLQVGWATTDITPQRPVFIPGQFHGRLPEYPAEPLTATALVLDNNEACSAFISCDLVSIFAPMEPKLRAKIAAAVPELKDGAIIINATHTHTGAVMGERRSFLPPGFREKYNLDIMDSDVYCDFVVEQVVSIITAAWQNRQPGKVAWGLDFAVVGRNRRWVSTAGKSTMYGNIGIPEFSHIEGFEDHSVNLLATYDTSDKLTGVVVNVPCPSQVNEHEYRYSPDYWHDTRQLLRQEFGENLFVMPQCSAAGDQAPRPFYDKDALARMERLRNQNQRLALASRLTRAVVDAVATITSEATADPVISSGLKVTPLPLNKLTVADVEDAKKEADALAAVQDAELKKFEQNPELVKEPRWYTDISRATRRWHWFNGVIERYEEQQKNPNAARVVTIHAIRVGDVAFASNPFELYLDYAIRIKARSPFLQTFVVQLAGDGTYLPSHRSTLGGGYGSYAPSNPIGPEGGQQLVEETLTLLESLYNK
jgi:GNAT superfamily N-acetyltransferase